MFNSLYGRISGSDFPQLMLTTGGMEWSLEVSARTFQAAIGADSQRVRLYTYLHHREDILKLYGFHDTAEREAFLQLIGVPGIGPRQALRILSAVSVDALHRLLQEEDVSALVKIPGLGQKTAAKVVLQLRGKLVPASAGGPIGRGGAAAAGGPHAELVRALAEMGFAERDAAAAIRAVGAELAEEGLPDAGSVAPSAHADHEAELFRRAIVRLSGHLS